MTTKNQNSICFEILGKSKPSTCPSCNSPYRIKFGQYKNNQRFQCKNCGKHYRQSSQSSIHRLHKKERIGQYIECMRQGLSLRKTATIVSISLSTAFRWRHKLLHCLQSTTNVLQSRKTTLAIYRTAYSEKGARLKSKEHKNTTIINLLNFDYLGRTHIRIKKAVALSNLSPALEFVPDKALTHISRAEKFPVSNQIKAQEITQQLDDWLNKFRGVATKYLQHYWEWFSFRCQIEVDQMQFHRMVEACI